MFRTVFPSIIRSSKLRIQQQMYVKQPLLPAAIGDEMEHLIPDSSITNKMHLFLKLFILVKRSTCSGRSFRPSSGAQKLRIQQQVYVKEPLLPAAMVDEMEHLIPYSSIINKGTFLSNYLFF